MDQKEYNFSKEDYRVISIDSKETYEWLLYKHYAHRIPSISYAFGLYDKNDSLVGVCTYGHPVAMPLIKTAFNGKYQDCFYELNRLCVNDGLPKKVAGAIIMPNIDWEQRRYEIAKAMLPNTAYMDGNQYGGRLLPEQVARTAVAYADVLIEELKKA